MVACVVQWGKSETMSNYLDRKTLLERLEIIRKALCAYYGSRCDCKLGATDVGRGHESGNGCPEVAVAIGTIGGMTDFEYDRVCKRKKAFVIKALKKSRAQKGK